MKGISTILEVIMIVIIVVALISLFWLFSRNLFSSVSGIGEASLNNTLKLASSCMRIVTIGGNKIILINCGTEVITNDSLYIFIDNAPFNFNMTPSSINQNALATISMHVWGISVGDHNLRLVSSITQISKTITSSLPDSCILALDFDEGSGNKAYDSSPYHNDGTIENGEGNEWTKGRNGYALDLDNDSVNVGNASSLAINNSDFSIEAWIKTPETEKLVTNGVDLRDYFAIARKHVDWANATYMFGVWNATKGVFVRIADNNSNTAQLSGSVDICDNQWHHVIAAVDRDSSTGMKLYVDGVANPTTGNPTSVGNVFDIDPLKIGSTYYFNGTIDSVRVYNKALTPDETVILKMK